MLSAWVFRVKLPACQEMRLFLYAMTLLAMASCAYRPLPVKTSSGSHEQLLPIEGTWQSEDDAALRLEATGHHLRFIRSGEPELVGKVLDWTDNELRLCENGRETRRNYRKTPTRLLLRDPMTGLDQSFRNLDVAPAAEIVKPLSLPEPKPLPTSRIEAIQAEIGRRLAIDQGAVVPPAIERNRRSNPGYTWSHPEPSWGSVEDLRRLAVLAEEAEYIRKLVSEVGWIDVDRFGPSTSDAALLLVQHSGDLPLMLAVLPRVEKELRKRKNDGDSYALLFDRVQLRMGEKQRYGTQIGRDALGQPFVLPVEDPAKVPRLREELGLSPLENVIRFFGGSQVRFSEECSR